MQEDHCAEKTIASVDTYGRTEWEYEYRALDDLVGDPEGFAFRLHLPDGTEWGIDACLRSLMRLYWMVYERRSGYVGFAYGKLRVESVSDDEVCLDLTSWVNFPHEPEPSTGIEPTVTGSRESMLALLGPPIREVVSILEDSGVSREELRDGLLIDAAGEAYPQSLWARLFRSE